MRERGAQVPSEGRKSYVGHDGRGICREIVKIMTVDNILRK